MYWIMANKKRISSNGNISVVIPQQTRIFITYSSSQLVLQFQEDLLNGLLPLAPFPR
jgi:hypothetical protein